MGAFSTPDADAMYPMGSLQGFGLLSKSISLPSPTNGGLCFLKTPTGDAQPLLPYELTTHSISRACARFPRDHCRSRACCCRMCAMALTSSAIGAEHMGDLDKLSPVEGLGSLPHCFI